MKKIQGENAPHIKPLSHQKEEQINNVLTTIKSNPKFIKLLFYSLNSLEGFISLPNKEIRLNSRIIISLEGLEILKNVGIMNTGNDDVLKVKQY
jgi:hypothetical protein